MRFTTTGSPNSHVPLNRGLLPADYYALPEQHAAGFGADVLTLQEEDGNGATDPFPAESAATGGLLLGTPKLQPVAETTLSIPIPVGMRWRQPTSTLLAALGAVAAAVKVSLSHRQLNLSAVKVLLLLRTPGL